MKTKQTNKQTIWDLYIPPTSLLSCSFFYFHLTSRIHHLLTVTKDTQNTKHQPHKHTNHDKKKTFTMDKADSKETHTSFPEFQYTNPQDTPQMPGQSANTSQPDKDEWTPRVPVVCPRFPLRYRILTQLGCVLGLAIVGLRALLMFGWLLDLDFTPLMGPLQHVVVFDKVIIGTFLGIWYMRFLVQIWEADLAFSKVEEAARGDARAKADIEALEKKRDYGMLLNHRPYNLSWIFGSRKGEKEV